MGRILGMGAAEELATIPSGDEELDGVAQGAQAAGEVARASAQAGQGVTQFGIVGFDGVGRALGGSA
jgi:hypothetical protein